MIKVISDSRKIYRALIVSLLMLGVVCGCELSVFQSSDTKNRDYSDVLVTRAIDGDTLEIQSGERLRLIGIDTPEMHESRKLYRDSHRSKQDVATIQALGRRAYTFTQGLVEGRRVRLEFDIERKDRYGRLLVYVYLKDGTFVNARIIEAGYASLLTIPPNVKYAELFQGLYSQARREKRGLWE